MLKDTYGRYESATQRCPNCRHSFHVLADEIDTHPCPRCGYAPWAEKEDDGIPPWESGDYWCAECESYTNHTTNQHRNASEEVCVGCDPEQQDHNLGCSQRRS